MTWWQWASTLPSAKKRCLRFEFHPVGASLQLNGSTFRRGGEGSLARQALQADGVLYSTLRALHQDLRIKHGFLIAELRELSRSCSHHIARVDAISGRQRTRKQGTRRACFRTSSAFTQL
jgi:hypothetical protein